MKSKRLSNKSGCAVEVTLSVIGGVWKPIILFHLLAGKKRFMELGRIVPSATQRMLTLQLRELESDGIISRTVYPQVPPKVEYALTPLGKTLAPVLLSLREWGEHYKTTLVSDEDVESDETVTPVRAQCEMVVQNHKNTLPA